MSAEQISMLLYAGPGSASLTAAAGAWSQMAAGLSAAAQGYQSTITELTGVSWLGPAAGAMASAATPYTQWLTGTAAVAEQTAAQLSAAASAFEQARASVVPPPVIEANRSQQLALMSANTLGQYTAEIAALEVEYLQMWMQNVMTMFGYASQSAAATQVPLFDTPPNTTSSTGPAGQTGAGGSDANSGISQLLNSIPRALSGMGGGAPSMPSSPSLSAASEPLQATVPSTPGIAGIETIARSVLVANDSNISILYGQGQFARNLNIDLDHAAALAGKPLSLAPPTAGKAAALSGPIAGPVAEPTAQPVPTPVMAGVGNAAGVGRLAVPQSWAEVAPAAKATVSPLPTDSAGSPEGLFADMAVAGLAGRAIAAKPGRPAAAEVLTKGQLEKLAGELTGSNDIQQWHTDGTGDTFRQLSRRPGVHTVHLKKADPVDPAALNADTPAPAAAPRRHPGGG